MRLAFGFERLVFPWFALSLTGSAGCSSPPETVPPPVSAAPCNAPSQPYTAAGSYTLDVIQRLDATHYVTAADLDGDGVDELLEGRSCPRVFVASGATWRDAMEPCTDPGTAQNAAALDTPDLDDDGRPDLVIHDGSALRVLLGRGTPRFAPQARIDVPGNDGGMRASPSQVVTVRVGARWLILLGLRGNGMTVPASEPQLDESCTFLGRGTLQNAGEPAPVTGYWYSADAGLRASPEIEALHLRGDLLGASVTDFNRDGTQEVVLANEHGPTIFLAVTADGRITDLTADHRAPRADLTSGMGVVVLDDARLLVSNTNGLLIYRFVNEGGGRFEYDYNHPLNRRLVPGEVWGCHAQDWMASGQTSVFCASYGDNGFSAGASMLPVEHPTWTVARSYFQALAGVPDREVFIAPQGASGWRWYQRPLVSNDLGLNVHPLADAQRPGRLIALRTAQDRADPNRDVVTSVVRPTPDGMSYGHGLVVRFRGWTPPIGTTVRLRCGGAEQPRAVSRTGAWTHTEIMAFGCAQTGYERVVVTPLSGSPITCPAGPMDRTLWIARDGTCS